jgi:hypothetical protein
MSPVAGLTDPTIPSVPGGSIIAFEERDSCPDCGASMAADQRYCLACGQRREDPRPPFLDAVASMDFADAGCGPGRTLPPPPSRQGSRGRSPTAKLGESCKQGTPGCGKSKKFNGVFFGAEE